MVPVLITPSGCYQLLQTQKPCPRAVVLAAGRWQTWTGGLSLHCHFQALHAALNPGTASSCEAAPHQPICFSHPGLSQPPAGLALGCPLVHRPSMAPAFSPHLPLCAHECELPSHLPGRSDETPARTRGTCIVHRWVASSKPRKMLRVPGPRPQLLAAWSCAPPSPSQVPPLLGSLHTPRPAGPCPPCLLALALLLVCFPQRLALAPSWVPGSG